MFVINLNISISRVNPKFFLVDGIAHMELRHTTPGDDTNENNANTSCAPNLSKEQPSQNAPLLALIFECTIKTN